MPKRHQKQTRNCQNETQQRDEPHGWFVRLKRYLFGEDKADRPVISRSQLFYEANSAANRRSALSSAERKSRNSSARINAARGYDTTAVSSSPPPSRQQVDVPVPTAPYAPKRLTRIQKQQERELAIRLSKIGKATAGRVVKPRQLAPLLGMSFSGARPLAAKRNEYPWA